MNLLIKNKIVVSLIIKNNIQRKLKCMSGLMVKSVSNKVITLFMQLNLGQLKVLVNYYSMCAYRMLPVA